MSGNKKHLVIACGGTGGHFYPTMAIAREFILVGGRVTLMIAGNHASEQLELAAREGLPAVEVPTVRLPRNLFQALLFPFRFLKCVIAARRAMTPLHPDVFLGMGSFASVPQCMAVPSDVPLYLHEGNSFMGKANRWLTKLRKVSGVTLSLPLDDNRQLHGVPSYFVGMPLRESIIQASQSGEYPHGYMESLGLKSGMFTILVFGGSQGAQALNDLLLRTIPHISDLAGKLQMIHLTGTDDNEQLADGYAKAGISAAVFKSTPDIHLCYLAANVVFCRAGASSICELALFKKPLFLIPLPTAADNHQFHNANMLAQAGAAKFMEQKDITPDGLSVIVRDAMSNLSKWEKMGEKLVAFANEDAAQHAADIFYG